MVYFLLFLHLIVLYLLFELIRLGIFFKTNILLGAIFKTLAKTHQDEHGFIILDDKKDIETMKLMRTYKKRIKRCHSFGIYYSNNEIMLIEAMNYMFIKVLIVTT